MVSKGLFQQVFINFHVCLATGLEVACYFLQICGHLVSSPSAVNLLPIVAHYNTAQLCERTNSISADMQGWRQGRARGLQPPPSEESSPPSEEILGSRRRNLSNIARQHHFSVILAPQKLSPSVGKFLAPPLSICFDIHAFHFE